MVQNALHLIYIEAIRRVMACLVDLELFEMETVGTKWYVRLEIISVELVTLEKYPLSIRLEVRKMAPREELLS